MEEAWMILRAIFKRLFQIHELILLLSLLALACLPIGLRGIVRDAVSVFYYRLLLLAYS
ncbi:hypothetical protein [Candidatus Villigracilis saccharophilus]|uniref:hypothetical protein n=1 Tax=Candidatus Villigracilis saccharophilus TaxID=3140684 RepID=UPI00313614E5|nr:hypothetical protein [Anaerolineales bacterium]